MTGGQRPGGVARDNRRGRDRRRSARADALYEGVHDPLSTRCARRPRRRTITAPCGARAPCPATGPDPERGALPRSETRTVPGRDGSTTIAEGPSRSDGCRDDVRLHLALASEPAACRALGIDAVAGHEGRASHRVVVVRWPSHGRRVSAGAESVELRRCVGTERDVSLSVSVSSGGDDQTRPTRHGQVRVDVLDEMTGGQRPGGVARDNRRGRDRRRSARAEALCEGVHDPLSTRSARRPRRRTITTPCGARAPCPATWPDPERGALHRSEISTVPGRDGSTTIAEGPSRSDGCRDDVRLHLALASEPAACRALGIDAVAEHEGRAPHGVVVVRWPTDERRGPAGAEGVDGAPRPAARGPRPPRPSALGPRARRHALARRSAQGCDQTRPARQG